MLSEKLVEFLYMVLLARMVFTQWQGPLVPV
jgi:hypothetical protein